MPTYHVNDPSGAVYEVNAPEGATEQDAIAYVQAHHDSLKALPVQKSAGPQRNGPMPPPAPKLSFAQGLTQPFADARQEAADRWAKHIAQTGNPSALDVARNVSGFDDVVGGIGAAIQAGGNAMGDLVYGLGGRTKRRAVFPNGEPTGDKMVDGGKTFQFYYADDPAKTLRVYKGRQSLDDAPDARQEVRRLTNAAVNVATIEGGAARGKIASPGLFDAAADALKAGKAAKAAAATARKAAPPAATPDARTGLSERLQGGVAAVKRRLNADSDLPPAPSTPEEVDAGRQRALAILAARMRKAGLKIDELGRNSELTTAENMGPGSQNLLSAIARRDDQVGAMVDQHLESRSRALPRRLESGLGEATGLDRTFIEGDKETLQARARAKVKPEFDAWEQMGSLTSPEMQRVLSTPHGRQFLEIAYKSAKDAGAPTSELAKYEAIINEGLPTSDRVRANSSSYLSDAQAFLGQRAHLKALRRARGQSLIEFLSEKGLADQGGDIASMDGHIAHKGQAFKRKLVREGGRGLDDAAVAAWERGYFTGEQPPTVDQLQSAIRDELAGKTIYAKDFSDEGKAVARITDFEDLLNHLQINPEGKKAAALAQEVADKQEDLASYERLANEGSASQAPEFGLVNHEVPTPRMYYDMKRALDADYTAREEAYKAGNLRPEEAARYHAKNQVYHAFRNELSRLATDAGHDFEGMVQRGGDAPKMDEAYREGYSLVTGRDLQSLMRHTQDWTAEQKRLALGGFVKKLVEDTTAKRRLPPMMQTLLKDPDFAARVSYLADDPRAGQQVQQLGEAIAKERKGLRMSPDVNSTTGGIGQANKELDGLTGGDVKVPKSLRDAGEGVIAPYLAEFAKGFSVPYRDEVLKPLGEYLIDHQAAAKALREMNTKLQAAGQPPIVMSQLLALFGVGAAGAGGAGLNALMPGGGAPPPRKPAEPRNALMQ